MVEELKNFKVKRTGGESSGKEFSGSKALSEYHSLEERLEHADRVLIGIGREWQIREQDSPERKRCINQAYEALYRLVKEKDYFLVTTNTEAVVFQSPLDESRIVAPCGNVNWRQCSRACTKDIWEQGEVPDDVCPHCGAPLTGNTVDAETYIEEGYLPQWLRYKDWLAKTMNRRLLILELGEGFERPGVVRWPFEKAAAYNQKAFLYRVNESFAQLAQEVRGRAVSVKENSVKWGLSNGGT